MKYNSNISNEKTTLEKIRKAFPIVFIHLILWVAFFSLPFLFRPNFGNRHDIGAFHMPIPILMNNIFLMIAFYFNLLVLMPGFLNKKRWGLYILITCIFLIGSFLIHYLSKEVDILFGRHFMHDMGGERRPSRGFEFRQFSFVYSYIMIWAISMVYYLIFQLQESRRHADKVYSSALQSELSFLKAQINPHFLFNTLNNIYVLTLKKSDSAPLAVMKLSNLMRQLTNDVDVDYVPFIEEEKFIKDYIELQQLRLTEKTKVNYEISGNFDYLRIAPRLLIPYIDNAFKYGVSNRTESEIIIRLNFEGSKLMFFVKNDLHAGGTDSLEESSGVGLENAKRRLDLLYEKKYILKISHSAETYIVNLEIDLS